jgi:hypothetical protein
MVLAMLGLAPSFAIADDGEPAKLDYAQDVRPILSDNCFACHGPDEKQRKAGLRLDVESGMFAELESGSVPVVPGKPDESELVFRVEEADPTVHMPPADSGKALTPDQVAILRRWVEQGAPIARHWAFVPPARPALPAVSDPDWPANEIDRFVLYRLDQAGLEPSPRASKEALIRRVTLDLTGLPPTPEEVAAFLADDSPDAFEAVVDRLLDSPRFGEHMARFWLDAARYGDTHGLHLDNYREMWPWRDWVIKAFNDNMPFDEFLVEQIAGDLLPGPSPDQLIATGYNRNHVSTNEGGSIEEEVFVRNVVDQVDTNGTVFLGLTVACARCHDHKYDPITQKDYYSLFAFFNSIDGPPMDANAKSWGPVAPVPTPEQKAKLADLDAQAARLAGELDAAIAEAVTSYDRARDAEEPEYVRREDYVWLGEALPPGSRPTVEGAEDNRWPFVSGPDHPARNGSTSHVRSKPGQSQHFFIQANPALKVGPGDRFFVYAFLDPVNPPREIMLQWNTGEWKHRAYWGENLIAYGAGGTTERVAMGPLPPTGEWVRLEVPAEKVGMAPGTMVNGWAFTQFDGTVHYDDAGLATWTPQPGQSFDTLSAFIRATRAGREAPPEIMEIAGLERSRRTGDQSDRILRYFIENAYSGDSTLAPIRGRIAEVRARREALVAEIPTTLIYRESPTPKPAYLLDRGEYDRPKDQVPRAVPGFLPPLPEGAPANRLGFARWLLRDDHPLTARVAVNRFWQQLFGVGIVKTAEDFGSQGEPPSHPLLLDWLAVTFREEGWDVKAMLKRMVMSAAYQQSSRATPDRLAKDPRNRLLSRGPRFRLDAEALRDQALFVGGLLVERLGGPSVKPPQPSGLWEAVGYTSSNTARFAADTGPEKVHRRSLYTFWKRTAAPPQMTTFDAPSREACTVRRERTNTPLQALQLMNEPQMVEAARALAERTLLEGGPAAEDRVDRMFRRVLSRAPREDERSVILAALADHLAHYRAEPEAARALIAVGERAPEASIPAEELAAWSMVANLLLNLDETINKN